MIVASTPSPARYLLPGIFGATVSLAVRAVFADLLTAVAGAVIFAIVYLSLVLIARGFKLRDMPVGYAIVAVIAVTVAFVITGPVS